MQAPCSQTSQPPELWEINVYCLSHTVCGILLQQPQLTRMTFHILLLSIKVFYYVEINVCIITEIKISEYYFERNPWMFRNMAKEGKEYYSRIIYEDLNKKKWSCSAGSLAKGHVSLVSTSEISWTWAHSKRTDGSSWGDSFRVHLPCWAVPSCFSHVLLCAKVWTVTCQTPLPMEFSRHEYWIGLLCLPPGHLPDPGIEPVSLMFPALAGRFFPSHLGSPAAVLADKFSQNIRGLPLPHYWERLK